MRRSYQRDFTTLYALKPSSAQRVFRESFFKYLRELEAQFESERGTPASLQDVLIEILGQKRCKRCLEGSEITHFPNRIVDIADKFNQEGFLNLSQREDFMFMLERYMTPIINLSSKSPL